MPEFNHLLHQNASALVAEFDWLCDTALWLHKAGPEAEKPVPPVLTPSHGNYGNLVYEYAFGEQERMLLALALAPHVHPAAMEYIFQLQQMPGSALKTQLHRNAGGQVWPVGFTALWMIAGSNLAAQMAARALFDSRHPLIKNNMIYLQPQQGQESRMMGWLYLNEDIIDLLTGGEIRKPDFNTNFPARLVTTRLEWDDLVLDPHTARQVEDIHTWLQFQQPLMEDWGMARVLKPGYKALFYGPPGTGKTLTATMLGKRNGLDVYRIDLSMVVSKYIGETEKNLEKVFARAEHKNWILFFDEADALFGKRTGISDAHDKYANQEVSYLLQRLEDYNGLVILSSNQRSNVDDAFARRLQSVIYFPLPATPDRFRIWQNAFSHRVSFEEESLLEWAAEKFELSGGSIMNVVQYASLQALRRKESLIRKSDLNEGIRREYNKEGRAV